MPFDSTTPILVITLERENYTKIPSAALSIPGEMGYTVCIVPLRTFEKTTLMQNKLQTTWEKSELQMKVVRYDVISIKKRKFCILYKHKYVWNTLGEKNLVANQGKALNHQEVDVDLARASGVTPPRLGRGETSGGTWEGGLR